MSWQIKLDTGTEATAAGRTSLELTDFVLQAGIDLGQAAIDAYKAKAQRGEIPVDFTYPNRTITIPLQPMESGTVTFAEIRRDVQAKAALFQREGGWLELIVDGESWYADVVDATLRLGGSTMAALGLADPDAELTLECLPDFYGAEVELDLISETTEAELTGVLQDASSDAVISGDYPARCRIVVTEGSGNDQRGLLWGLRSRHYDDATTAALAYEAEDMTPVSPATVSTLTGASGGATDNRVSHAAILTAWTAVLTTDLTDGGALTHKGSYRVFVRAYSTQTTGPRVRLTWGVGDLSNPVSNDPVRIPGSSQFYILDLGEIRLDPAPVGTHQWRGQIEAIADAGVWNVSIDKVWFVPIGEAAGRLVSGPSFTSTFSIHDEFDQTSGNLTGKTLASGETWAGAGDSADWTVDATNHRATRTASSDVLLAGRFAIAGSTAYTDSTVQATFAPPSGQPAGVILGVVARYTDTDNYVLACLTVGSLFLTKVVDGTASIGDQFSVPGSPTSITLALTVRADGSWAISKDGVPVLTGQDVDLATDGDLESGKVGFYAENNGTTSHTITVDDFIAATTSPVQDAALFANQKAELRHDGMFHESSTDGIYKPIGSVIGDLVRLPPSGIEERKVELVLKASRGDFDTLPDSAIDDISAQVFYRPSWLTIPGT